MEQALAAAWEALGRSGPNPSVSAVLVKDGVIVARGATQPPGQPHAEVMALNQAGDKARGATLYVTMEPCAHQGRTPPCAPAIVAAGVAQVHMATLDPNPLTNGKGQAILQEGKVQVTVGEHGREAQRLIEAFTKHVTTGLPFVTAKFATSLDGKIATATGDSRWITGEEARREAHRLRAHHDAVMVGVGTVVADDPQLTVRDVPEPPERQPLRVVVDGHGRLSPEAKLLREPGRTLVATCTMTQRRRHALEAAGAEVVALPGPDGQVDLGALLRLLGEREVVAVLAEGGGTLLGSLFDARLVDKVVAFVAPVIVGGGRAPSPVAGQGAAGLAQALRLHDVTFQSHGQDMMVVGYPHPGE